MYNHTCKLVFLEFIKKQKKYEQNLILIMKMHYQERKYKFKNYMRNSYKYQRYQNSNRPSNLQIIYIYKRKIEL